MLDGRHTGTGGGNHLVLGGATPADSPVPAASRSAAQPDRLLAESSVALVSVFRHVHRPHQPGAARRRDARRQLLRTGNRFQPDSRIPAKASCPPWLVDRIFRHILVDVTGNTHRAEFCIDKLYSPDSATGRLGLLELRAFEMPPHARMSLAQQLLVRALIALVLEKALHGKPIPWGTRLHDRFMLPHFVGRDFGDVIDDLQRAGYPFEAEWFAPHFEFRFPVFGRAHHAGVTFELRQAIEPWYVLGEEGAARRHGALRGFVGGAVAGEGGGSDRPHDISSPATAAGCRCNPPDTQGEYVAGVRYRAWQPPSCLHPTIPVHTPLIFDMVDTWTGRSHRRLHLSRGASRRPELRDFPGKRERSRSAPRARFFAFGHTPGPMRIPAAEENPDFPLTLDLRRPPPHSKGAF